MGIFILACVIWSRKCKKEMILHLPTKSWNRLYQHWFLHHFPHCFVHWAVLNKGYLRLISISLQPHGIFKLYIETWIEKTGLFVNKCYLYFIIAYFGLLIPKLDMVLQHKITCLLRPVWKCPSNCFRISLIK